MSQGLDLTAPLNLPKITKAVEDALLDAQEIAFEAWGTDSPTRRKQMALKALEISPYCIDAYNILAQHAKTLEEAINIYLRAEEVGKKYFGKKFFRENKGIFWSILETRPYMRAKNGLSNAYKRAGDKAKAMVQLQEMLELCEGDNLGVRDELLPMLIEAGEIQKAEELENKYEDDASANWLYARVLLEFACNGPRGNIAGLLTEALEANKEAAKYLALKKKMPSRLPGMYSPGSKDEAVYVAYCQLEAWKAVENACEWLAAQLPATKGKKKTGT